MPANQNPEPFVEPANPEAEHRILVRAAHNLLLSLIGVFALAEEEVEALLARSVERGEIAEKDARKLLNEVMEKRKKKALEVKNDGSRQVKEVKDRMVPASRQDINAINEMIDRLSSRIDEIKDS